ncbi:MAG: hypothetical protein H7095_02680 [Pseudopedobacter sp.]|nr:hypothetical protein [Deinococcales bacterium]
MLLSGLILSSAQAATLRLYPNFAEVRRTVEVKTRALELDFSQSQMNGLVGGSLYLSSPKVLSRLQTVKSGTGSLERFEGKTVYLREDGKVRPVKLIRASSGLVQDLQTGRFRSGISVGQLEFSQPLEPSGANSVRYRYTLPQNSVYSLPFLSPKVTVKRVARLETNFYSSFIKGKFQRLYRLTSNVLLPARTVTVRDVDRVVGSQSLPDLTANEEHNLRLGQDPDLNFTRYVKVSSSSRVKVFGTVQRRYTYNIYSVTLQRRERPRASERTEAAQSKIGDE